MLHFVFKVPYSMLDLISSLGRERASQAVANFSYRNLCSTNIRDGSFWETNG